MAKTNSRTKIVKLLKKHGITQDRCARNADIGTEVMRRAIRGDGITLANAQKIAMNGFPVAYSTDIVFPAKVKRCKKE